MITTSDLDDETIFSRFKTLILFINIAFRAAFLTKKKHGRAYVIIEAQHDGYRVRRKGQMGGNWYTLYFFFQMQRDMVLKKIREHEGSEATLENARIIINSQQQ